MSFSLLPLDHQDIINGLPSFTLVNNTLLLIQTIKNVPNYSLTCLEGHQQQQIPEQDDSLAQEINSTQKVTHQTPDIKKKRNGCTCRKTNCLKNYCECFSSGKQCTPDCACYGCYNTHEHSQLVKQTKAEIKGKGSRKSNNGCICKKSQCQKKYCECFNAGVACTNACKCLDCQNHTLHCHSDENSSDGKNKNQIQNAGGETQKDRHILNNNFCQSFLELDV